MNRSIASLLITALLVIGGGYWLQQLGSDDTNERGLFFPDLMESAPDLERITLTQDTGTLVELVNQQGRWMAVGVEGSPQVFPANAVKLREFLTRIARAKRFEAKTAKAENYHRLGVEDIATADSQGTLVELMTARQTWALIVGNNASGGQGSFVRVPEQAQAWLLDQNLSLPTNVQEWLAPSILDIGRESVLSMGRLGTDGWTIQRRVSNSTGEADFELGGQPEDTELKYRGILANLIDDVLDMEHDRLRPYSRDAVAQWAVIADYQVKLQNGNTVELRLMQSNEDFWLQVDPGQQTSLRHDYWLYGISSFKASQLNKTTDDFLLAPAVSPEEESTAVDEGAAPDNT